MPRREHPRYEHMEWAEWEFREYPMMIYPGAEDPRKPEYEIGTKGRDKGRNVLKFPGVVVNDDDELARVLKGDAEISPVTGQIVSEEEVRQSLIRECELHGLKIDRRWGTAKLEEALKAVETADEEVTG